MREKTFSGEQWQRLCHLMADRLQSRVWLMKETLQKVSRNDPGGEVTISIAALQGVCYMVEDIDKELMEALDILDF